MISIVCTLTLYLFVSHNIFNCISESMSSFWRKCSYHISESCELSIYRQKQFLMRKEAMYSNGIQPQRWCFYAIWCFFTEEDEMGMLHTDLACNWRFVCLFMALSWSHFSCYMLFEYIFWIVHFALVIFSFAYIFWIPRYNS